MKQAEFFYKNENAPIPNRGNLVGATTLIECEGKILLEYRVDSDRWSIIGGSLKTDESFVECAIREVQEETGIVIDEKKIQFYKLYDDPSIIISYPDGNVFRSIMVVYRVKLSQLPELVCSHESRMLKFFDKEELRNVNIVETHTPILQDYLEE